VKRVTSLDVGCPTCGASPGLQCQQLASSRSTSPHPKRQERARAEHVRLNPEHVHGQLDLFPAATAKGGRH